MTNAYEMTDADWAALEYAASHHGEPPPKLQPANPVQVPATAPPLEKLRVETPEEPPLETPVRIKSADEIVAEYACTTSEIPADSGEHGHPKFEPPPVPARRGATRAPQAPQHLSTARTEVVELRREVAELTQLVKELHARVVGEGG